jgi:TolA-binding protein
LVQHPNAMSTKVTVVIWAILLVGAAVLFQRQQATIARLQIENATLRAQVNELTAVQEDYHRVSEELRAALGNSQNNQSELLRLRGQASKLRQLEQDNTQLKAQRQRLEDQLSQKQANAASQQPQRALPGTPPITAGLRPEVTDLGTLELQNGVPVQFDLGGGTNCVITPTALPDGTVSVRLNSAVTGADGNVSVLAAAKLVARPGQACSISVGDRMIALAVTLKP